MRALVLAVVLVGVVSIIHMWPSPSRQWVGIISDVEPGQWIRVANEMNEYGGFRIALTTHTNVDGDPSDLRRNVRVAVVYTNSGGGAVARQITILPDDPRR